VKLEERLQAYRELTGSAVQIHNWILDDSFHVVETDCPDSKEFLNLVTKQMKEEINEIKEYPMIYSIQSLLYWIVVVSKNHQQIYVKGPFFNNALDDKSVEMLFTYTSVPANKRAHLQKEMQKIAIITSSIMFQYAQMLYYAVYEKSAALQDVETYNEQITHSNYSAKSKADQFEKGSGRWNLEQEILYKVRNGDTNISDLMSRASASNRHSSDVSAKSISEAKRNVDQLLTLISRAAVEGGLPQKTSFSLCTEYRKQIDRCQSFGEVAMLSNDLLIDYIQRVKRMKTYAKCSVQIRLCIEYIENHLDEKITLNHLAKKIGYTSTYLSKLFNEEIGMVLTEFVQKEKINRAKFELTHTGKTIEEISYDLGFTTRSYFATVFRKYEKMSPKEYREKYEEF